MRTLTRAINGLQVSSILAKSSSNRSALFITQPIVATSAYNTKPAMPGSTPDFSNRDPNLHVLQENISAGRIESGPYTLVETTIQPSAQGEGLGPSSEQGVYTHNDTNADVTFSIGIPMGQSHPAQLFDVKVEIEHEAWRIVYVLAPTGKAWSVTVESPVQTAETLLAQDITFHPKMSANMAWGVGLIGEAFALAVQGTDLIRDPNDEDDTRPVAPSAGGEFTVTLTATAFSPDIQNITNTATIILS